MTTVYFIRHAEPDYNNHDDHHRPLTARGLRERALATAYLWDKNIATVLSSPFVRAHDTVADFAVRKGLPVHTDADFRERTVSDEWITDWRPFTQNQWRDFDYKLTGGESLRETQSRNIAALHRVLDTYAGQNVVIGSHGTALSTVINFYDPTYGHDDFRSMAHKMPWTVKFVFDGTQCVSIEKIDLSVRLMTMADYPGVSALWQTTDGLGKTPADDSPEAVSRFLERNPGISMVVDVNGEIAAVVLCGHDGRRASVYHTAVSARYQGLGLGKAIMGAVYDALLAEKIRKVSVVVFRTNKKGDAFWEKEGFTLRDDLNYRNRTVPGME